MTFLSKKNHFPVVNFIEIFPFKTLKKKKKQPKKTKAKCVRLRVNFEIALFNFQKIQRLCLADAWLLYDRQLKSPLFFRSSTNLMKRKLSDPCSDLESKSGTF